MIPAEANGMRLYLCRRLEGNAQDPDGVHQPIEARGRYRSSLPCE